MGTPERPVFVIDIMTGPDTLCEIQRLLDTVWAGCEVPELVRMHMDLAASEVGTNIIEHAGHGRPVRLRMTVEIRPNAVTTTFIDDGDPASVDLSALSMPDELSDRGRGLAVAHRVLDELSYHRDAHGNHWILTCLREQ